MATRLKNIVRFTDVPPGVPTSLPHLLNIEGRLVVPDFVEPQTGGFTVTANVTDVTVINPGPAPADLDVLVEHWHTFERAFGVEGGDENALVPQPFVVSTGGGPAVNVLPAGSVLCGTYLGDTVVLGDASLGCDTFVVGGSLFIQGNLTSNGWDLDVDGDLQVRGYANFSGVPVGEAQGLVRIRGDLFTPGGGEFHPAPAEAPSLTVDGDWFGGFAGFDGTGLDGANGLTVVVGGDVILGGLLLAGGLSTLALDAGNGGILVVSGDCQIGTLLMDGGGSALAGRSAGTGGTVAVSGNYTGNISASGGSALSTDAGNGGGGGNIHIAGSASIAFCEVNGGACASDDPLVVAGIGGTILVDGSLTGDGHFGLNGGFRQGTGVVGAVIPGGPGGGTLQVRGDMNVGDIGADGGSNFYEPDANSDAGHGGIVQCNGDIKVRNQIIMLGGEVAFALGIGGNGGSVTCARLSVSDAGVFVPGGFSNATNGAGGVVWTKNGMSVPTLRLLDGAGPGAPPPALTITQVLMGGDSVIGEILMDDRGTDTRISPTTNGQGVPFAKLKVNVLTPKNTLNANDGTVATGAIATPETQLFFTTEPLGASWFSVTGVVVP